MTSVADLHREAMAYAHEALALHELAADFEYKAALMIERKRENEPTRCILYRSAASLYLHACMPEKTITVAKEGLSGFPIAREKAELKSLIRQAKQRIKLYGD